jgi:hypothetical protein
MKKILFTALLASGLVLGGCDKEFAPELPGTLSPMNFPSTESDFELYAMQTYKPFGAKWGYSGGSAYENMFYGFEYGHLVMFELPTDYMNLFTRWGGFWEFFSQGDFSALANQGRGSHFEKIRYVTNMTKIIDDLEKSTVLGEDRKNKLVAEVRMGRGLAMYNLLHLFGPVPVILDPALINTVAEADMTRPSREFFVNAIEQDLRVAATHLEKTPAEYGRFNKGLALGTLLRLHLNEKNWPKAEEAGRELLTLGYSLVPNYASLFREATERNNETIWAVSVDPNATGNDLQGNFNAWGMYTLPSDFRGNKITDGGWGGSSGVFTPTWAFYDSFNPADTRRATMVPEYTAANNKGGFPTGTPRNRSNMPGPVLRKYLDEGVLADLQGNDIVVLRHADVLLMLAEAINQTSGPTAEAVELVNQVRRRAFGKPLTTPDALADLPATAIASKQALHDAILEERGKELLFEGVRKIDLVRHDKWRSALVAVGKQPGPSHLHPIPRYAIQVSDGTLSQNPGYE